jgi:hypothetical protein
MVVGELVVLTGVGMEKNRSDSRQWRASSRLLDAARHWTIGAWPVPGSGGEEG